VPNHDDVPIIALVGDRSEGVRAHGRIPDIHDGLRRGGPLELTWVHSREAVTTDLSAFDGVWVVPGSPYADEAGVLHAIRTAREEGIPFLGTCGGFQHLLLELARDVCGLITAAHQESSPDAELPLIVPMACSLLGESATITVVEGTKAAAILGAGPRVERYFCGYQLDPDHVATLEAHGLVVSARDELGDVRMAELPEPPFLVGSLFQPELSSTADAIHPLIEAFAAAVRSYAGRASLDVLAAAIWSRWSRVQATRGSTASRSERPRGVRS
jgi:CTP synthase (UTP-ammonia lyase)